MVLDAEQKCVEQRAYSLLRMYGLMGREHQKQRRIRRRLLRTGTRSSYLSKTGMRGSDTINKHDDLPGMR